MNWLSAALGWLFLRTVIGGAVMTGMVFVSVGQYALGAAVLSPLVAVIAWMAMDMRSDGPPELPG